MKQQSKLTSEQQHDTVQHTGEAQGKMFGSPEELLRFDATQTPVPGKLTERLNRSVSLEPRPDTSKTSWLRRLFGGS